jgi:nuclear pore complex protein Nup133
MSQRSRQRLAANAEKLYAAHQLWLMHNEFLAYVSLTSRYI